MLSLKQRKTQIFTPITRQERKQGFLSASTSPLLHYTPNHALTLGQSFEGIQVFGGTGSGKTSGSFSHIARSMLHAGFGGLVLCAKEDEANNWRDYAEQTGRTDSLIIVDEEYNSFNFMAYELARGGSPFEAVKAIENARDALTPESGSGGDGQVWKDAAKDLLVAALVILYGSTGSCDLGELKRLIGNAPPAPEALDDDAWRDNSIFCHHVGNALRQNPPLISVDTLNKAIDYFTYQFAPLADRTRSSVVMNLMTTLNRFDYGVLSEKFTKNTTVVPELTHGGAVIVIDLPAMSGEDNRIAGHIWKYAFQRATTRQADASTRPVFLFADEAQYFYSRNDVVFQSTARSSRVSTIYATQSLDSYRDTLGGSEKAATATRAFLANLRTQIFHANDSEETNVYAATLIGKTLQWRRSRGSSKNRNEGTSDTWSSGVSSSHSESTSRSRSGSWSGGNYNTGWQKGTSTSGGGGTSTNRGSGTTQSFGEGVNEGEREEKDFRLDPDVFSHGMRSGNVADGFQVDAVIVSPEIPTPYLPVTFDQRTH